MSDIQEFTISEETFNKLFKLKRDAGFVEDSWDEWFNNLFPTKENSLQSKIEKSMETLHYQSFDDWVKNFGENLKFIWKEPSARDLVPSINGQNELENTAIVIGRGPSIKEKKHLELLAESNFGGIIVCTDGALISALKAGVTPKKFPNFYVVTIDPQKNLTKVYDDPVVDKYGKGIKGIFSTIVFPPVLERARKAGIKIHWVHSLFDYQDGKKSFNHISSVITRVNQPNGLPALQTGGNVGTSAWFVAWKILKCSVVCLIGIDHGWKETDPIELIMAHGNDWSTQIDKKDPKFEIFFPKIYNPEFKCYCILDPIFQFYSSALKEFISRSPSYVNTINATEGGCIFGNRITCMKFDDFLEKYLKK